MKGYALYICKDSSINDKYGCVSKIYKILFMEENNTRHYKFINSETGNVIYYLTCTPDEADEEYVLENMRQKLAYEKGMYIENIYYSSYSDTDWDFED